MAKRPAFIPMSEGACFVSQHDFEFQWHPGFSLAQKQRNINALHDAAAAAGYGRVLEISTKSPDEIGRRLSAFNLAVTLEDGTTIPLECAFQGSKVFEHGGPFIDLYNAVPRVAKRDPRLHESGTLVEFLLGSQRMPRTPPTAFYDWLYINVVLRSHIDLSTIRSYDGFTDIEFNSRKSLNCQARACAQFVSMSRRKLLDEKPMSVDRYLELLHHSAPPTTR